MSPAFGPWTLDIYGICFRDDIPNIDTKRSKLNKDLKEICDRYELGIIDNKNIDSSCLAKKKLHLSMKHGIPRLANNFKQFIQN